MTSDKLWGAFGWRPQRLFDDASVVLGQVGAVHHNMWKSQGRNKDEGTNNYTSSLWICVFFPQNIYLHVHYQVVSVSKRVRIS